MQGIRIRFFLGLLGMHRYRVTKFEGDGDSVFLLSIPCYLRLLLLLLTCMYSLGYKSISSMEKHTSKPITPSQVQLLSPRTVGSSHPTTRHH